MNKSTKKSNAREKHYLLFQYILRSDIRPCNENFRNFLRKSNGTVFLSVLWTKMLGLPSIEEGPRSVFREPRFARLEIGIREYRGKQSETTLDLKNLYQASIKSHTCSQNAEEILCGRSGLPTSFTPLYATNFSFDKAGWYL